MPRKFFKFLKVDRFKPEKVRKQTRKKTTDEIRNLWYQSCIKTITTKHCT